MSNFFIQVLKPFLHSCEQFSTRNAFCINNTFFTFDQLASRIQALYPLVVKSRTSTIGIIGHDHIDTYAAIWAIWLANKNYVPLNPSNPTAFNDRIKQQLSLDVILDAEMNPEYEGKEDIKTFLSQFKSSDFSDGDNAYILFTSGSTGLPKGVPITKGNLAAFMDGFWEMELEISEHDKGLQMFELTFDLSVISHLIPLIKGGCVYTVPKNVLKFAYIMELLSDEGITIALMVPSMLKLMRPYFDEFQSDTLRYSLFCGEALHVDLTAEWSKRIPNARIDNVYGPTENTVFCTYYTFKKDSENISTNGILSIGKPMKNCSLAIVNDNNEDVNQGEVGELLLEGEQLTLGYLNNEELNASAFVLRTTDTNRPPKRFYKSGDLCLFTEDGNINYIGRKDTQVKIQGFRVELSEIEFQAMKALNEFKNCCAIAIENERRENEIYLVIEGEKFDTNPLKEALKLSLPWYMLPMEILFYPHFPMNTNGKIDKKEIKKSISLRDYTLRNGTIEDIDFIVEAIVAAEKGNSDVLGTANLLEVSEEEFIRGLHLMLKEELEGCEYSAKDFIITEFKGKPVAALCAWIEGMNEYNLNSSALKMNLFKEAFGYDTIKTLEKSKLLLSQMRLSRSLNTHQVEYVYVKEDHRKKNLVQIMIDYSLQKLLQKDVHEIASQIEVFTNNLPALKAYQKIGYEVLDVAKAEEKIAKGILPHHEKAQLQKTIKLNNP